MIVVVGGAGYLGSVLTRDLLARGYRVKVIDRGLFGIDSLSEISDRIEIEIKDQRDIEASDFQGAQAVINIGGLSNDPTAEWAPEANVELNCVNAGYLAEVSKEAGVERYIFGSSCSVYDRGVYSSENLLLTEEDPVKPTAAYSSAKLGGENLVLAEHGDDWHPTILRKGTLFGLSPRMRYDLVVNTFVRHAIQYGKITAFYCGRMWRPLCSVQDAARAYVSVLESDVEAVSGEIFNVVSFNARISELALEMGEILRGLDVSVDVRADLEYRPVRSYSVSGSKITKTLGFYPVVSLKDSVEEMVKAIRSGKNADFNNPKYYNIEWLRNIGKAAAVIKRDFDLDPDDLLGVIDENSRPDRIRRCIR